MEIGWPSNVRHIVHVTFDKFSGFLGLPVEFEPEVPQKAPSASTTVFGVSTESMQLSFDSRGNSVPTILLLMQKSLYSQGGLQAEGIFRITAENSQEEYVREQLNKGEVPEGIDVHCLAGLIKAWFRELPRGVLDSLKPEEVMQCQTEDDCVSLAKHLPPIEAALLGWSVNLMADVVEQEHVNKMGSRNIAMVFAPNMTKMADPLTALMYAVKVMNFLRMLILRALRERGHAVEEPTVPCSEPSAEGTDQSELQISPHFTIQENEDIEPDASADEPVEENYYNDIIFENAVYVLSHDEKLVPDSIMPYETLPKFETFRHDKDSGHKSGIKVDAQVNSGNSRISQSTNFDIFRHETDSGHNSSLKVKDQVNSGKSRISQSTNFDTFTHETDSGLNSIPKADVQVNSGKSRIGQLTNFDTFRQETDSCNNSSLKVNDQVNCGKNRIGQSTNFDTFRLETASIHKSNLKVNVQVTSRKSRIGESSNRNPHNSLRNLLYDQEPVGQDAKFYRTHGD